MSARVGGFVGDRLRQAREVRGYTGIALAQLLGIAPATVTNYEMGRHAPTPYHLDRIVQVLNFKPEFFLTETGRTSPDQLVFSRSRSAATSRMRRLAEHRRVWLRDIAGYLAQQLRFPPCDVPTPPSDFDWRLATGDAIESLAVDVRAQWKLSNGPISNVTVLCEHHGVMAGMYPFGSASLDAFSLWDQTDGRPYIVLGDDGQTPCRTRFNVCHELGHLVMHRDVTPTDLSDRATFNLIERQAHRFAGAFLVPAEKFRNELSFPTLDALLGLKPRWRVSVKMLIHRTGDLGIVDDDYIRRLYINYNRRGWNEREPFEDDVAPERPLLLRRAFEAMVDRDIVDRTQILAALPFNQDELEALVGLPSGYLDELPVSDDVWGFLGDLTSDFPGPEDDYRAVGQG